MRTLLSIFDTLIRYKKRIEDIRKVRRTAYITDKVREVRVTETMSE